MTRRVFIECSGYGQTGARYRVTNEEGRVLLTGSRTPAFDAARTLFGEGVTGRLEIWRVSAPYPAMVVDIEKAAKLAVVETATIGPKIAKWNPPDFTAIRQVTGDRASACGTAFPVQGVHRGEAEKNFGNPSMVRANARPGGSYAVFLSFTCIA